MAVKTRPTNATIDKRKKVCAGVGDFEPCWHSCLQTNTCMIKKKDTSSNIFDEKAKSAGLPILYLAVGYL